MFLRSLLEPSNPLSLEPCCSGHCDENHIFRQADVRRSGKKKLKNFESGAENWGVKVKPLAFTQADFNAIPNDFPALSGYLNYVNIDFTYSYEDTYILKSTGIIGDYKKNVEAKLSISGESPPYDVKVQYWKASP